MFVVIGDIYSANMVALFKCDDIEFCMHYYFEQIFTFYFRTYDLSKHYTQPLRQFHFGDTNYIKSYVCCVRIF